MSTRRGVAGQIQLALSAIYLRTLFFMQWTSNQRSAEIRTMDQKEVPIDVCNVLI